MALTIENPEAARLAKELAAQTGESVDDAILYSLQASMARQAHVDRVVRKVQQRIAELPVVDDRSADEILGYDESGLPH